METLKEITKELITLISLDENSGKAAIKAGCTLLDIKNKKNMKKKRI